MKKLLINASLFILKIHYFVHLLSYDVALIQCKKVFNLFLTFSVNYNNTCSAVNVLNQNNINNCMIHVYAFITLTFDIEPKDPFIHSATATANAVLRPGIV